MRFISALLVNLSLPSLLLALLFLAASHTPSLIPRGPIAQGVLGGLVMALGYLLGRIVDALWLAADLLRMGGRAAVFVRTISTVAVLGVLAWASVASIRWQDDLRMRMRLDPAEGGTGCRWC